jgi:hypothetical protein
MRCISPELSWTAADRVPYDMRCRAPLRVLARTTQYNEMWCTSSAHACDACAIHRATDGNAIIRCAGWHVGILDYIGRDNPIRPVTRSAAGLRP